MMIFKIKKVNLFLIIIQDKNSGYSINKMIKIINNINSNMKDNMINSSMINSSMINSSMINNIIMTTIINMGMDMRMILITIISIT